MNGNLISTIDDFIRREKIDFSFSKDNPFDFWLDDSSGSITVRFKINVPTHEILYDIYSPKYISHLKEETLDDVKHLESLAEEHRQWKIAELIEELWLILDQIKLWAVKNNFRISEKNLL